MLGQELVVEKLLLVGDCKNQPIKLKKNKIKTQICRAGPDNGSQVTSSCLAATTETSRFRFWSDWDTYLPKERLIIDNLPTLHLCPLRSFKASESSSAVQHHKPAAARSGDSRPAELWKAEKTLAQCVYFHNHSPIHQLATWESSAFNVHAIRTVAGVCVLSTLGFHVSNNQTNFQLFQ